MTADLQMTQGVPTSPMSGPAAALRLSLGSGLYSVPLRRIYHLSGYARLKGEPEDYFLGWLTFRGDCIPVFDLDRVVCDQATAEQLGCRILVLRTGPDWPTDYVGFLAGGATDTVSDVVERASVQPLDLDSFLPMLATLVPPLPDAT